MRATLIYLSLSAVLLVSGCSVPSIQPVVDRGIAVTEPRLLGRWESTHNPAVYEISADEAGHYKVATTDASGNHAVYSLRCGSLGGRTLIDIYPLERGAYQAWDFMPLHSAFVVDFTDAGMRLSAMNPAWYDQFSSGQAGAAAILRLGMGTNSSAPVLTAPTRDIQALYATQLGNPEAFREIVTLIRLPEMAQLREITKTLVAAQMAYYAKNGSYADSLAKLASPPTYIDSALADGFPLPGSRIALKSGAANGFLLYVLDSTGRGYRANETGVVQDLLEEDARDTARSVAAAQFAYYAANGRYAASLPDLTAPERYLDDATATGRLESGITVSMFSGGGDSFVVCVSLPDGPRVQVDETGELRQVEVQAAFSQDYQRPAPHIP
jgi:hypothetical protein